MRDFIPSPHSVIFAEDYKTPESLAKYLLYLANNDTAYNEYLDWKVKGPSKEFVALADLSIRHSDCRLCIRSADIDRLLVGEVVTGPYQQENEQEAKKFSGKSALCKDKDHVTLTF